jgi:hypothetical protein
MAERTYDLNLKCSVCGGGLTVTRVACRQCGSELTGRFHVNEFASLNREELELLRAFIAARGNIKEVEAALGISYPTVRGRLEKLAVRLGLASSKDASETAQEVADRRKDVLDRLAKGEIAMVEAERLLSELRE